MIRLVLLFLFFTTTFAYAHSHGRPDLDSWFKELRAKSGASCCDGGDGTPLDDPSWMELPDRYRVKIEGVWYDVPIDAHVLEKNIFGLAVVWYYPRSGWGGKPNEKYIIRCFMPGPRV